MADIDVDFRVISVAVELKAAAQNVACGKSVLFCGDIHLLGLKASKLFP